jgi:copper(I)-binding protein
MTWKPWLGGLLAAVLAAASASAETYRVGSLEVGQPWARETTATQKNGAAYLTVVNRGDQPDRLVAIDGDVAETAELHVTAVDAQGVATMRPTEGIEVPAGGEAVLAPGGTHIMLMSLRRPLAAGTTFPLSLRFEQAGTVAVQVAVQGMRDAPAGHGAHGATGHKAH